MRGAGTHGAFLETSQAFVFLMKGTAAWLGVPWQNPQRATLITACPQPCFKAPRNRTWQTFLLLKSLTGCQFERQVVGFEAFQAILGLLNLKLFSVYDCASSHLIYSRGTLGTAQGIWIVGWGRGPKSARS